MKSTVVKYISVVLISVSLAISCSEIFMRIAGYKPWAPVPIEDDVTYDPKPPIYQDSTLGYKMLPGVFKITYNHEYTFTMTHNVSGYRITSVDTTASDSSKSKRINIFGDSFTHGSGLNDSQTYPWLLQQTLPDWRINNYAISGYGVANVLTQINKYFPPRKGDIYIYSYFAQHNNRYERRVLKMVYAQPQYMGLLGYVTLNENLTTTFHPYDYKMCPISKYSALANFLEDSYDAYLDKCDNVKAINIAQNTIGYLNAKCKSQGAVFILFGIQRQDGTEEMLKYCREQGILCADISVDLSDNKFSQMPYDAHPNGYSNTLFSKRIYHFLLQQNLLR